MSEKVKPPPRKHGKKKKYFFTDLKIGDEPMKFPLSEYYRVKSMAATIGKRNNMKFATRKNVDNDGMVSVYRVRNI